MNDTLETGRLLRALAEALGAPTHLLLLLGAAACLFECGVFVHERFFGPPMGDAAALVSLARGRINRVDGLARVGPMLGLMGTLIPLGPGLSALGRGDVASLAAAVTVAFDTTVLGLAIGIIAFGLARARRGFYDRMLDALEARATQPASPPEAPAASDTRQVRS